MDGRPTWTDCDEAGDYVVPNVLSPSDLVFRPDNMDETVPHTLSRLSYSGSSISNENVEILLFSGKIVTSQVLTVSQWKKALVKVIFGYKILI